MSDSVRLFYCFDEEEPTEGYFLHLSDKEPPRKAIFELLEDVLGGEPVDTDKLRDESGFKVLWDDNADSEPATWYCVEYAFGQNVHKSMMIKWRERKK